MEELAGRLWPEHLPVSQNPKGSRFSRGFLPSPTSLSERAVPQRALESPHLSRAPWRSFSRPLRPDHTSSVQTRVLLPPQLLQPPHTHPQRGRALLAGRRSDLNMRKAGRSQSDLRQQLPLPRTGRHVLLCGEMLKQGTRLPAEPRPLTSVPGAPRSGGDPSGSICKPKRRSKSGRVSCCPAGGKTNRLPGSGTSPVSTL